MDDRLDYRDDSPISPTSLLTTMATIAYVDDEFFEETTTLGPKTNYVGLYIFLAVTLLAIIFCCCCLIFYLCGAGWWCCLDEDDWRF